MDTRIRLQCLLYITVNTKDEELVHYGLLVTLLETFGTTQKLFNACNSGMNALCVPNTITMQICIHCCFS